MPKFYIIEESAIPVIYKQVSECTNLLRDGVCTSVFQACKIVGISRTTYYKYKDKVQEYVPDAQRQRKEVPYTTVLLSFDVPNLIILELINSKLRLNDCIILGLSQIPNNKGYRVQLNVSARRITLIDKAIQECGSSIKNIKIKREVI